MNSGKLVVFGQNCLYSGKSCCIRGIGCIWEKIVLFGQNWLCSGKLGFFGKKWLYSGKLVLFMQNWFYLGKIGSILAYSL